MEQIHETFHTEFEIVRLKDVSEKNCDYGQMCNRQDELKLGIYLLIKKEFHKRLFITISQVLNREDESRPYYTIKDEVKLYYKKLFKVYINFKEEFEIDLFADSKYHLPGWSAKYEGSCFGTHKFQNTIEFAHMGPYEIEDNLKGRGLGSYMIDAILVWATKNYSKAIVKISIGFSNDTEENIKRVNRLYGKRELAYGVRIEETKNYFNNNEKIERISCEDFIVNVLKYTRRNVAVLSNYKRENANLHDFIARYLNREKYYRIAIGILSIAVLILGVLLKTKFS